MLSLTRWNPLDEIEAFHREFDRFFGRPGWSAPSGSQVVDAGGGGGLR